MVATDASAASRTGRLSKSCFVLLRSLGLELPLLGDRDALSLPELILIAKLTSRDSEGLEDAIADVAQRTAAEPELLRGFLDELAARGLLVDRLDDTDPARGASGVDGIDEDWLSATATRGLGRDTSAELVVATPLVFRPADGFFELVDHDGRLLLRLDPVELAAVTEFRQPTTRPEAFESHSGSYADALDPSRFDALVERLGEVGILERFHPETATRQRASAEAERQFRENAERMRHLSEVIDRRVAEHDAAEREREVRTGTRRTRVVQVNMLAGIPQLALGMIVATVRTWEGGRLEEHYDFHPGWVISPKRLDRLDDDPSVFLFSNYVWSHNQNLALSKEIKRRNPASITIHGGPDTPRRAGDVEAYFRDHPHVDVAVRNEGEFATAEVLAALVDVMGDEPPDLSTLAGVPGIWFRGGDGARRTEDRDRIVDLDTIPSPYLTGFFDVYDEVTPPNAIIETNRGCPYGCTFCDWGAATQSRIRKFSLDRVFAELEWCASHKVSRIALADANFGILERDVEIAEKVAELKEQYGYPTYFSTNYAKNTVKHLKKIVEVTAGAGIVAQGLLSLQSMDEDTLTAVKRTNIKLEKYEDLAREFRKADLPLYVDIMLGLPGSTTRGFRNDLQQCVDREVTAKVYKTELLVNSPMNEPTYREEHRIQTERSTQLGKGSRRSFVVSTASFTRDDYDEMLALRRLFILCDNYGVLRHIARFVRHEVGIREVDFYERCWRESLASAERWPTMRFTFDALPQAMVVPVSWRLFIDEVHDFLVEEIGLVDDSALRAVLDVQHGILPARDRSFPLRLELAHDYVSWHRSMIDAKDAGHRGDWPDVVPRLTEFGPGHLVVDDPDDVGVLDMGFRLDDSSLAANWELRSPVSRALESHHSLI